MQESGVAAVWIKLALQLAAVSVRRTAGIGIPGGRQPVVNLAGQSDSQSGQDLEALRLDRLIEHYYVDQLAERGIDSVILSQSTGRMKVDPRCAPEVEFDRPIYFISAPFDPARIGKPGSQSPVYSALSIYTRPGRPELADSLATVVVNCTERTVFFSDTRYSYEGNLDFEGKLTDWHKIAPNTTEKLAESLLEAYLMKPNYLYPAAEKIKFLFRGIKFIPPEGGPNGYCDVASGKADVYFAFQQPHTDVFSGIAVAERVGCQVTTFGGLRVGLVENPSQRYNVICSANAVLHQRVLKLLESNGITDDVRPEDV